MGKFDIAKWAEFGAKYGLITSILTIIVGALFAGTFSLFAFPLVTGFLTPFLGGLAALALIAVVITTVVAGAIGWVISGFLYENVVAAKISDKKMGLFVSSLWAAVLSLLQIIMAPAPIAGQFALVGAFSGMFIAIIIMYINFLVVLWAFEKLTEMKSLGRWETPV